MRYIAQVVVVLILFVSATTAFALVDPGLENPGMVWNPWLADPAVHWADPPYYTQTTTGLLWVQVGGGAQHGGNYALKATGTAYGGIYENALAQLDGVGTGIIQLTGGTLYELSYWVRNEDTLGNQWQGLGYGAGIPNLWEASWSRCLFGSYDINGAFLAWDGIGCVVSSPTPQWAKVSMQFTTSTGAAKGYLLVQCHLNGNQSGASSMYFDDFSLAPVTVPEPGSIAGLVTGIGLLGNFIRRRR